MWFKITYDNKSKRFRNYTCKRCWYKSLISDYESLILTSIQENLAYAYDLKRSKRATLFKLAKPNIERYIPRMVETLGAELAMETYASIMSGYRNHIITAWVSYLRLEPFSLQQLPQQGP